jgi:hypothetical protein
MINIIQFEFYKQMKNIIYLKNYLMAVGRIVINATYDAQYYFLGVVVFTLSGAVSLPSLFIKTTITTLSLMKSSSVVW